MSSIITITFNPAIDKTTSVDSLVPEKKMKCSDPVFNPGGGGINVARAIKKLGGEAKAIYLAGGYPGKFLNQLMIKESVNSESVEIESHTRENLIVLDKKNNQQYRFGMPGPNIIAREWKHLLEILEGQKDTAYIIASGSIPKGVPDDILARISIIAKNKKAKYIVDSSGIALKNALNEGVYLLKPNLGELSSMVGDEWMDENRVEEVAREIINKGKCEVLVISMGEKGARLVTRDVSKQIIPPPVQRKSTVGAGDSMVGGIVLSLSKGKTIIQAVQYGVACGTAATMNPGSELCRLEDAEMLYEKITMEK